MEDERLFGRWRHADRYDPETLQVLRDGTLEWRRRVEERWRKSAAPFTIESGRLVTELFEAAPYSFEDGNLVLDRDGRRLVFYPAENIENHTPTGRVSFLWVLNATGAAIVLGAIVGTVGGSIAWGSGWLVDGLCAIAAGLLVGAAVTWMSDAFDCRTRSALLAVAAVGALAAYIANWRVILQAAATKGIRVWRPFVGVEVYRPNSFGEYIEARDELVGWIIELVLTVGAATLYVTRRVRDQAYCHEHKTWWETVTVDLKHVDADALDYAVASDDLGGLLEPLRGIESQAVAHYHLRSCPTCTFACLDLTVSDGLSETSVVSDVRLDKARIPTLRANIHSAAMP